MGSGRSVVPLHKQVQSVTLTGNLARVIVDQDDSVTPMDHKACVRHTIRATVAYADIWKHAAHASLQQ